MFGTSHGPRGGGPAGCRRRDSVVGRGDLESSEPAWWIHRNASADFRAERAARLCKAAEENSHGEPRFYVIGTEVPVTGGATHSLSELSVTTHDAARQTLRIDEEAFAAAGLQSV